MRKIILFTICIQIIAFTESSRADDLGSVSGVIKDANGRPVSNAIISIGNKSDFTDIEGQYRIKGLKAGKYEVQIKKGARLLKEDVEVKDTAIKKDLSLKQ